MDKNMIRLPDFLTEELFERFRAETKKKKPNTYLDQIKWGEITEGLCCQMLHIGRSICQTRVKRKPRSLKRCCGIR